MRRAETLDPPPASGDRPHRRAAPQYLRGAAPPPSTPRRSGAAEAAHDAHGRRAPDGDILGVIIDALLFGPR